MMNMETKLVAFYNQMEMIVHQTITVHFERFAYLLTQEIQKHLPVIVVVENSHTIYTTLNNMINLCC